MSLSSTTLRGFGDELQKLAGADISPNVHSRFDACVSMLHEHGVYAGTPHKRIIIPKDVLTTVDLHHLGFKPSFTAVPEEGQDAPVSFRHPDHKYHLHPHGSVWTMHADAHPATKGFSTETLRHVITDGVPAIGAYLRDRVVDREGSLAEKVRLELPRDFFDKMEALRRDS